MSIDEKVELCNVSKYIRKIPKYRYNGSYILKPGESVVIERDKINFFKPYSAIGIVVRNIVTKVEKEVIESKEVISNESVDDDKLTETTESHVEKVSVEEPVGELKEEIVEDIKEEVKDVPDLSKLDSMNLNQLKEMAKGIGLKEAASMRKKVDVRNLIRKFYEQ